MVPRGDDGPASVDDDDDDGGDGPASVEVKIGLLGFGSGRQEVGGR